MAVQHISYNPSLPHGSLLRSAVRNLANALDSLNDIFKIMELMKDGAVYGSYLIGKFGFDNAETAQGAFDELNSLLAKLNTNASVTDVNAAILQLCRKLG